MLGVYTTFVESFLAIPVLSGPKTESERFPGAVDTFAIETMMQDRKALQAGTSHFLGQNFAKASGIEFQTKQETREFAWTTSWGMTTRLIGALVMTHSDDDGLILPPKIAPTHVIILPILRPDTHQQVMDYASALATDLRAVTFGGRKLEVEIDARDLRGGEKSWEWIKKGAPLRIEVGPRDVEANAVTLYRRDQGPKERKTLPRDELVTSIAAILGEMQDGLLARARAFRDENTKVLHDRKAFDAFFTPKNADKPEIHGGFAIASWCGSPKCEADVKEALKVTIRCIPTGGFEGAPWAAALTEKGPCVVCGQASERRVVFAKSY